MIYDLEIDKVILCPLCLCGYSEFKHTTDYVLP